MSFTSIGFITFCHKETTWLSLKKILFCSNNLRLHITYFEFIYCLTRNVLKTRQPSAMQSFGHKESFSRDRQNSVNSDASVHELIGDLEDRSLIRAGEDFRVQKCHDVKINEMAYKYCKRCLGKTWGKIEPDQLTVTYIT